MSNTQPGSSSNRILDAIERGGNRLPDPTSLFLIGTLIVMALSHLAWTMDWTVTERMPQQVTQEVVDEETGETREEPVLDEDGDPVMEWQTVYEAEERPVTETVLDEDGEPVLDEEGEPITRPVIDEETGELATETVETDQPVEYGGTSLLTRDGFFYALSTLVDNFMAFPPLGVVLVGMLGIGVAERTGMIKAALRSFMLVVPGKLLTPAMVFLGILSSIGVDAGYVVLPPLAAALYLAVGRSPLAGLAAVFAGVSAGFAANLSITGLDPMLAGFTETGARIIHAGYEVNPAANWWFMIVSTIVITLTGWWITSRFVESRLKDKPAEEGGPSVDGPVDLDEHRLKPEERRALRWSGLTMLLTLGFFLALIFVPGGALETWHTDPDGPGMPRWAQTIVPMIFFIFVIPGIVYGISVRSVTNDKDVAKLLIESMSNMAPIIVLAFFAAQFVEFFSYSGLGEMLALAGGQFLGQLDMNPIMLMVCFVLLTMLFNLFIGSMSAKYAIMAPIFVPMFMMVGISPELSQVAYRIGDSVSNVITPLNPYLIVILVFMQKYVPRGGIGTLIATMFPYTVGFLIMWTILLMIWMGLGIPLGPDGGLTYDITQR